MTDKLLTAITMFALMLCARPAMSGPDALAEKAREIHARVFTIDSHVDTPLRLMRSDFDLSSRHQPGRRGGRVDFIRMQEGELDAIFFAAFIGQGERTPAGNDKARNQVVAIIEKIKAAVAKNPNLAELAFTPADADRLEAAGKRAIFIGIENGYAVGQDLGLVHAFYDLGARYITLCHTRNNDICDSSTDEKGPEHQGLSEFGKSVVLEMNRLGLLVDVSHISDQAFYDVLGISGAPVIASHSGAWAMCNHPRNLKDAMLKKLAENGGVIQVCLMSSYVKKIAPNPEREAAFKQFEEKYPNRDKLPEAEQQKIRAEYWRLDEAYPQDLATVADLVNHIDHIVKVAGIDHVGIGSDFDGGGALKDCRDVSEMGNITLELVRRGYSEVQIRKIWGGNFMRAFRQVEKVAEKSFHLSD